MENNERTFDERVVKIVESCDGVVLRTFYCIRDPDFGHWMSCESFDGKVWTKDPRNRQEFDNRMAAEGELQMFLRWREEQKSSNDSRALAKIGGKSC